MKFIPEGSQLQKTIRVFQGKDPPKGDGKHQLKRTIEKLGNRK